MGSVIKSSVPQAVLIGNPNAGRLSDAARDDVVEEARSRFNLEVHATTGREAAKKIASEAAQAGIRVVIAFGGDGHVNEVANGVAGTDTALGIIPGGTMNVFARALGLPLDPLDAIDHLEDALRRESRSVTLGQVDDRYFTFCAGCGFDAEAAERVEGYVPNKRRFGELFFYWSAFKVLATSYRHRAPSMTLKGPFGEVRVAMAIASNAGPYAYFLGRAVNLAPDVRLEQGLDVFALKTMRLEALPFYVWRVALSGDLIHHPDAFYASDLGSFEVTSEKPFSRHVDGEPLPPATSARFQIVRDILKVQV